MEHARAAVRSIWFRIALTLVLIGIVALTIDWELAGDRLREGSWAWFAGAVGLSFVSLLVGGLRWHEFLRVARVPVGVLEAQRAYLFGFFANNFLPTGFGGDAARAWMVGRSSDAPVRTTVSVLADRTTSLMCGFLLAWLALAADPGSVPTSLTLLLLGATVAGALGAATLYAAASRSSRLAGRLPERVREWGREGRATLRVYAADRRLLVSAVILGMLFQLLGTIGFWMTGEVIDADAAFALIAVAMPLVIVLTVLPISIAGFGVREGGLVVLLGEAGISATDATVISLLIVASQFIASSPGAPAALLRKRAA